MGSFLYVIPAFAAGWVICSIRYLEKSKRRVLFRGDWHRNVRSLTTEGQKQKAERRLKVASQVVAD